MGKDREVLATALADVFLAGLWSGPGLRMGAALVLGSRHGWVRRLTAAVLDAYPHAPLDRPRELAAFVATSAALDEVQQRASRPGWSTPVTPTT